MNKFPKDLHYTSLENGHEPGWLPGCHGGLHKADPSMNATFILYRCAACGQEYIIDTLKKTINIDLLRKHDPSTRYSMEEIKNAPAWFTPGIICQVTNSNNPLLIATTTTIVWYKDDRFIDIYGNRWSYAEPIESWFPKVGEVCAFWDSDDATPRNCFIIAPFYDYVVECGFRFKGSTRWQHVARLSNPDGRVIDCACSIEELKRRTDWL